MTPLLERRLASALWTMVKNHGLTGHFTDRQVKEFEEEKSYLLKQFKELSEEGAWWSDSEWEWFLNRCIDFLEGP